ncbi:hypothetical protein [Amycolatopsis sp. NPDC059021]
MSVDQGRSPRWTIEETRKEFSTSSGNVKTSANPANWESRSE